MPRANGNEMPHNIEAEQAVLGSILIDGELQGDIIPSLKESDFYPESHKLIFEAMVSINAKNQPVDLVTLADALEKNSTLERAGGIDYLSDLTRITPSSANYKYYLDIVQRDGTLRKLIRAAQNIITECRDSDNQKESLAFAEKSVYDISEEQDKSNLENITTKLEGILGKFESIQKDKNFVQGLKTGFTGLDNLTNGLHKGNLVILAARPSIGKTTLAMNIVENVAIKENAVCAVFALEMTKEELAQRMLCSVANVSGQDALKAKLQDGDWEKLWAASNVLRNTKIFVDDTSMTTCPEILSKCRRLKSTQGRLDLIVVDHIQLMNAVKQSDSRQQEVTEISRSLKMIAKELEVPVLALSQLSRMITSRKGQRPQLSDLRESGAIEQDADIVMFIHRPDKAAEEKEIEQGKVKKNVAEIILAKNRAGQCDSFELLFKGEQSKFINMPASYIDDSQIPGGNRRREKEYPADEPAEPQDDFVPVPPEESENIDDIFG